MSPDNPTGAVYPPAEVEAIGRWAVEHGIWVVTDEIYEHLTYGDHAFTSMPTLVPELADPCVIVNGVAKTYAMTGWRVGWMIGPKDVIAGGHQPAVARHLERRQRVPAGGAGGRSAATSSAVAEMRAAFDRRGRTMHELLSDIPGVTCLEPQGAFYCFPSFEGVLGRPIAGHVLDHHARAGRRRPVGGQGGHRAGRGVRCAGLRAASRSPSATTTWSRASRACQKLLS